MTSDRTTRANRANAKASTGPRTPVGKARSSRNARKHGLSVTDRNPQTNEVADHLAEMILGDVAVDPTMLDAARAAARAIAEIHLDLRRILECKNAVIKGSMAGSTDVSRADAPIQARVMPDLLEALERLERYERRAFSRRKTAIRWFESLASRNIYIMSEDK